MDASAPEVGQIDHHDEILVVANIYDVAVSLKGVPGQSGAACGHQLITGAVEEMSGFIQVIPKEHGKDREVRTVVRHGNGIKSQAIQDITLFMEHELKIPF